LTRALYVCAGLALALAVIAGRWQLAVFAAPMLGVLATSGWQRRLPAMAVRARSAQVRCFEGEDATVEIELDDAALARLDEIFPGPGGAAPEAYAW